MHSTSVILTRKKSTFSVRDILGLDDERCLDKTESHTKHKTSDDTNEQGKKTRQCFTTKQVEQLEKLFNEINYPDAYTRQMLAKKLKVSESRIQIWCQNRRAKIRRQRKQRQPIVTHATGVYSIQNCQPLSPWDHPLHHPLLPFHHNIERSCKSCSFNLPLYERRPELHLRNIETTFTQHSKYFQRL